MIVRLTQIDGKLPNLALMALARWHRDRGDEIAFSKSVEREMFEPGYERVYGSAIFAFSADRVARFRAAFPGAIVGGTWSNDPVTVEDLTGADPVPDYSIYPGFTGSLGFTQRGCRLKCGFCVVPKKEGKNRSTHTVADIWRGEPWPKHLHLLDNDFFGQPRDQWEARIDEIRSGGFKVCLNQGINVRLIDADAAKALASIPYSDDQFTTRRLYTAWDNLRDEEVFFRGVDMLESAGISPARLMAYMLIGYDARETWARVFHRFNRMVARGIRPYPMIFEPFRERGLPMGGHNAPIERRSLREFQRWVIRKAYTFIPFEHYDVNAKGRADRSQQDLFGAVA
jgi:hypothetical protein